ncbi:Clan CA, family C54, ATG4-like cysteine peptidase [Trichomonas vaginalis G3]|uniref:Cysteine protease n=1 Tax=Trichomonas vaginalis (strain ATCC PRA-98 / G3) TaxID=412133 RepID=A2FYD4_TRIV3|nr:protein delipidation [Trichomonas vaginalis G3]EAX90074.1 Clan CA, family C54, ATG4-like cysteine peptidase [Trichomonas vaginalis G3]KAI5485816.1 protein delipidation [Trichomonas vaginalis G3]|eukprot:XP_001303004.1 Clan CA, family C54, ATG4-like cysteine peptidase [Trichomonas vaginalis G3]
MTVILGTTIIISDTEKQRKLLETIPRFTYHKNFAPLQGGFTTDKNWGCCIRSAQGLIMQFITKLYKHLGDDIRNIFPTNSKYELFYDLPHSPFGLPHICAELQSYGVMPGEWVKPSLLAPVIKEIMNFFRIPVVIAEHGCLSREVLNEALSHNIPVLLLFTLMLGYENFELKYLPFLKLTLSLIYQSVGVVGGQQGKAYFIVGHQKEKLLYFDPHDVNESITKIDQINQLFKPPLKVMPADTLSSSMLVGFFITNLQDAEELPMLLNQSGECPIHIVDKIEEAKETHTVEGDWDIVST